MLYKDDTLIFSTGRHFYAYLEVIGLNPFAPKLTAYYGFDGSLGDQEGLIDLSPAEKRELADAMIAAWSRYGEKEIT